MQAPRYASDMTYSYGVGRLVRRSVFRALVEAYVLATLAHRGNAGARLQRLQDRASEQPEIAPDTKTETEIKKISAPNLTISIRSERVALLVLDGAISANYFEPLDPSLPPKKPSGRV